LTAPIGGQKARFVCLVYACLELPCDRAVYGGSVLKEEHGRRERQVSGELYDCKQPFGVERFSLKQSVKIERPPSNAVRSQTADTQQKNCRNRQLGCSTHIKRTDKADLGYRAGAI
jgi:hypothetical protein